MALTGSLVSMLLPALGLWLADGAPPVDVVVTAAPPIDGQRLADAMRAYLDEYGIRVESAAPAEPGDLRRQLADTRRIGEAVRAMAVVRAQNAEGTGQGAAAGGGDGRGTIEIELIDLATGKALIAEVPRPRRDEDLYRAVALKIQATLRATLSEAPERLGPRTGLALLARSAPPAAAGDAATPGRPPARVALETGYALLSFPLGGVQLHGLAVGAAFAPRPWLEIALGAAVLGSARAEGAGVTAVGTVAPLLAALRARIAATGLAGARVEYLAGPTAGLAYVSINPSSTTVDVAAQHHIVPALGAEIEARLRPRPSAPAWIYLRAAALGVLLGERYRAEGQVLFDTSRLQASVSVGVGLGIW